MNLPSASYIARCGKPPRSWSCNSSDIVRDLRHSRNSKKNHPSPEIKSEDMASVYSDAGDTFLSRPSNAASEDHHDAVSAGLFSNVQRRSADHSDSRDFILERFLPAAQAMAATGVKSSATSTSTSSSTSKSSLPAPENSLLPTSSAHLGSSKSAKSRYVDEVKQDVRGDHFDDEEEEIDIKACGFPIHLGKLSLQHFRYSFWTSRSSSGRIKSTHQTATKPKLSKMVAVIQDEASSENSDDLFWSDEEDFEDAMSGHGEVGKSHYERGECSASSEVRKRLAAESILGAVPPIRLHSMETVHTPDHRGFLGLPKTTKLTNCEMERARQVDRLGARLTRMISKTNYMETSRNAAAIRANEHDETDQAGGSSSQPSATTSSSSAETPRQAKSKWMDAVASLMPPPSPKMPSESWLSNTLPPERFLEMKKLSRKSLGSFIPIKPPLKSASMSRERHTNSEEIVSVPFRQTCSLREHLQGRYEDHV